MSVTGDAIKKIREAGFTIEAEGDHIAIEPFSELSESQLVWVKVHKGEILAELKAERVVVHVPEYTLTSGEHVAFDMDLPRANLPALKRTSLQFQLKDNGGGGFAQGWPGESEEALRDSLGRKYGNRLESINGSAP